MIAHTRIALLQKCRSWNIDFLDVRSHGLGGEGWSGLARAVRRGMIVCLSMERVVLAEAGREDLKMVWEASTRWNVEGKIIEREILWAEEPDTRVGWEIIEDLQGQAQPCTD